jgi:hypothetical protein
LTLKKNYSSGDQFPLIRILRIMQLSRTKDFKCGNTKLITCGNPRQQMRDDSELHTVGLFKLIC